MAFSGISYCLITQAFHKKLEHGRFYPNMPKGLNSVQKLYAQEILDAMQDDSDDIPRMVISSTAKFLSNILEDGYVDARYSFEFPGSPARGIALNNLRIAEKAPDIQTMINKKYYDHTIVLNLLVQYVNAGEVNNLSGYSGELLDRVMDFIPVVDDCLMDEDGSRYWRQQRYTQTTESHSALRTERTSRLGLNKPRLFCCLDGFTFQVMVSFSSETF